MKVDELVQNYPFVYHMAERGTWPNIREHGLRSTSALLDLYEYEDRDRVEATRRPESVRIRHPGLPNAIIRDNKPLSDIKLRSALTDMTVDQWYRRLNGKVFFWLTVKRLVRFLSVRSYRDRPHDVITIPTARLLEGNAERVWLTGMNTGTTSPFAFPRGSTTFMRPLDFPFAERRKTRSLDDAVVELAVDGIVHNVESIAQSVTLRQGSLILGTIWRSQAVG